MNKIISIKFIDFLSYNAWTEQNRASIDEISNHSIDRDLVKKSEDDLLRIIFLLKDSKERHPKTINKHIKNLYNSMSLIFPGFNYMNKLITIAYLLENAPLYQYFSAKDRSQDEVISVMKKFYTYERNSFQKYLTFRLLMAHNCYKNLDAFNFSSKKLMELLLSDLLQDFGTELFSFVFDKDIGEIYENFDFYLEEHKWDSSYIITYMKHIIWTGKPHLRQDKELTFKELLRILNIKSLNHYFSFHRGKEAKKTVFDIYFDLDKRNQFRQYLIFRVQNSKKDIEAVMKKNGKDFINSLSEIIPDIIKDFGEFVFKDFCHTKGTMTVKDIIKDILKEKLVISPNLLISWQKKVDKADRKYINGSRAKRNARIFFIKELLLRLEKELKDRGEPCLKEELALIKQALRFPFDFEADTNKFKMFLKNNIWSKEDYNTIINIGVSTKLEAQEMSKSFNIQGFHEHIKNERQYLKSMGVSDKKIAKILINGFTYDLLKDLARTSEWNLDSLLNMNWFKQGQERRLRVLNGKSKKIILQIKHNDNYGIRYIKEGYRSLQFNFSLKHFLLESILDENVMFEATPKKVKIVDHKTSKVWVFETDNESYLLDLSGSRINDDIHFNHQFKKVHIMITDYITENNYSYLLGLDRNQDANSLDKEGNQSYLIENITKILNGNSRNYSVKDKVVEMPKNGAFNGGLHLLPSIYHRYYLEMASVINNDKIYLECAKKVGNNALVKYLSKPRSKEESEIIYNLFFSKHSNQNWKELFIALFDFKDENGESIVLNKISSSEAVFWDYCRLNNYILSQFPEELLIETFGEEGENLKSLLFRLYNKLIDNKYSKKDIAYSLLYGIPIDRQAFEMKVLIDYADSLISSQLG